MSGNATIENYVQAMRYSFQASKAGGLNVTFQLQLTGDGGGNWTLSVANRTLNINSGAPPRADITITMNTDNYLKLAAGQLQIISAYRQGQVGVNGNQQLALKFAELFPAWASYVQTQPAPTPSPTPAPQPAPAPAPTPGAARPTLVDYVKAVPNGFRADRAGGLKAIYQFELSGAEGGAWAVTVTNGLCTVSQGHSPAPNVVIRMSDAHFIELAKGRLSTVNGFRQGLFQLSGDLNLAARFAELFGAWANSVGTAPAPAPTPTPAPQPQPAPAPAPSPAPTPTPTPTPVTGPVNPRLMNGNFEEYQPYVRKGEAKFWKEPQFPEEYGKYWTLEIPDEERGRLHIMNSLVFGKFAQRYFGGGGLNYKTEGTYSQVIASRYQFDLVLYQTVAAQSGREYTFSGRLVTYYKGTSPPPVHDKIFYRVGIDPTGGRDFESPNIVWGPREGRDNEWRRPTVKTTAQAGAITVFLRIENTEKDVGETDLNLIHLDEFALN